MKPAEPTTPVRSAPAPVVLATGLTESNPQLLWDPVSHPEVAPGFGAWRDRLEELRPSFLRVPIYWAQLQPDPSRPPGLALPADGCLRGAPPCGQSRGLTELFSAIASLQRAGHGSPQVEVVISDVPAWAAQPAAGCERSDAGPGNRPISDAGLAAYGALVERLVDLGRATGATVRYWSPWNEPNHPTFISPQRAACSPGSPTLAPDVYAQLVRTAKAALDDAPGDQQLVLGEMAGTATPSPRRTAVGEFVAALPDDVACSSRLWAQHEYAVPMPEPGRPDPVTALEQALDARPCTRGAHIWITETGVGAEDPGGPRPTDGASLRAGCRAQDALLRAWAQDPRVDAAFQYTFREDSAYPVGLADPGLTRIYPTYALWKAWGNRPPSAPPPALPAACQG